MTLVREVVQDAATGVGVAHSPEDLHSIHRPECAAAIWWRYTSPGFQSWIDALAPDQLPRARVVLRPRDVRDVATQICESSGTPEGAERAHLISDVTALASVFAELMDARYLRMRFDVVTTNACRKFHIDRVTARLICTYRGTGTQYGISTDEAEPQIILTVPTGAPIILRGTLWPKHPKSGLLHRSPPIDGTGETRLVLVLDPVADPDEIPIRSTMH